MRPTILCLLLLFVCSVACKGKKSKESTTSQKEIGRFEQVAKNVKSNAINGPQMHGLQLHITTMELANNRMPSKEEILAYVKKEDPKLSKLLEEGVIVLTGATTREGVWAYEKDAPTNGGWVITGSGESKMTAEELKQRLGN
jgi:hypothetical protein